MNGQTPRWIRVAECDHIPPREGRAALIGDRFLAVDNQCPHQSGPLCDGIVAGDAVVCPLHQWKVNLETGAVARPADHAECIRTYATRVEAGILSVNF